MTSAALHLALHVLRSMHLLLCCVSRTSRVELPASVALSALVPLILTSLVLPGELRRASSCGRTCLRPLPVLVPGWELAWSLMLVTAWLELVELARSSRSSSAAGIAARAASEAGIAAGLELRCLEVVALRGVVL